MVRARGLEPPILSEPDPKSGASAIPPRARYAKSCLLLTQSSSGNKLLLCSLINENAKVVRGLWNDEFLRVLENFPAGNRSEILTRSATPQKSESGIAWIDCGNPGRYMG